MSTKNESKINKLLQKIPGGTVILTSWLSNEGYSYELQQKYKRSNWLESIGNGAYKRTGEEINILGAIYALQFQAGKPIHIGGRSSLTLLGFSHYIEMKQAETVLFAPQNFKLPVWFLNYNWNTRFVLFRSNLLPPAFALENYSTGNFTVRIANPARAMLECLEMAPSRFDLEEAWFIMESLNALQPAMVQQLLENCKSIKAKRLFLYFAEKANHAWVKYLLKEKIDLGNGKRSLVKQGTWIPKYQITVPKNLA